MLLSGVAAKNGLSGERGAGIVGAAGDPGQPAPTRPKPTAARASFAPPVPDEGGAATGARRSLVSAWRGRDQRLQRRVCIRQSARIDLLSRADQPLDVLVDIPNVDVHPGHHASVAQPEGDKFTALAVAAEDHLVPGRGVTGVL